MGVFPPSPRVSKLYCRSIDPKVDQRKLTKPLNLLAIDNALYTRNAEMVKVHLGHRERTTLLLGSSRNLFS